MTGVPDQDASLRRAAPLSVTMPVPPRVNSYKESWMGDSIAYIGSPELYEQVCGLGSIRQRAP